ncbi:subclass B1 metallo-beta-lactamase [Pontixanthobacter aquaemixtae]|uniref:beta-lactamase n=1 Tax=Pontixanthobacter aquaemixtae TaxID=1958940 RepID=A0A844ZU70_9SPHN|nr:subclass B1 metallo-beta-lactamase [Pontixanthobacter aquaemixtae]MXO90536.1 subclass B1 metallo-beta-lactamase [Pontixanthobacter aquaemixtae]
MITHLRALVAVALALSLTDCTYRELRPSIAEQQADVPEAVSYGPITLQQIAPTVWQHTSYLDLPGFGAVASNGLIIVDGDRSVLVDTAWTVQQTEVILRWTEQELKRPIRAAVVTHAHSDKMGGIDALHSAGVATYAHPLSNRLAPANDLTPALNELNFDADGWAALPADGSLGPLRVYYPGPGHTDDNITVAISGTAIAFGGCLIKASDARSLGNLADADVGHYTKAVENFAAAFPQASTIAMSHSKLDDRDAIKRTLRLAKDL